MAIMGIDGNYIKDSLIGLAVAIGFIVVGTFSPFISAIGIPSISQSIAGDVGRFIIVVVAASIFEEIFFREFILDFFDEKLKNFGLDLPYFFAALISSALFALFHFIAYSSSLSAAGGSFVSAAVVGMGFCYLRKYTSSILPSIISHSLLNWWIITKISIVLG